MTLADLTLEAKRRAFCPLNTGRKIGHVLQAPPGVSVGLILPVQRTVRRQ